MLAELEAFYQQHQEPNQSCLLALRSLILDFAPEHIHEERKWGLPFFYFKKKAFCYLWIDKKTDTPYVGIMEGRNIEHTTLIKGNRKRIKILPIDPNKDIPLETLYEILSMAKAFY